LNYVDMRWSKATEEAFDHLMERQPERIEWGSPVGNIVAEVRCGTRKRHLLGSIYLVPEGLLFVSRSKKAEPPLLRQAMADGTAPEWMGSDPEGWWPTPDLLDLPARNDGHPGHPFTDRRASLDCRCGTFPRPDRSLLREAGERGKHQPSAVVVTATR